MAKATKTTVIIHKMMSLLRFFSSAIWGSTPQLKLRFKYRVQFPKLTNAGRHSRFRACSGPNPFVPSELKNLAHVDGVHAEVQRVIDAHVGREP